MAFRSTVFCARKSLRLNSSSEISSFLATSAWTIWGLVSRALRPRQVSSVGTSRQHSHARPSPLTACSTSFFAWALA